jgi:lysophospholipase L1-like esterase
MELWPRKPLLAIATFAAIIAAPQFIPQFHNWRIFEWATVPTVLDFEPRKQAAPVEEEQARLRPDVDAAGRPSIRILDSHGAMDAFFASLSRTERGEAPAVTRILHYGDSPTTADMITADVRSFLQLRFGDAGHGAYLPVRPWAWYNHRHFDSDSSGWKVFPATLKGEKDGAYGLAGVSFNGQAGARSYVKMKRPGASRLIVSYMGQPDGGKLSISADGEQIEVLDTQMPEKRAARETYRLGPGTKEIELKVVEGEVRIFSLAFESGTSGVIYESLGLNGVWAGVLAHFVNEQHWAGQLREERPDLVILNYGTNESGFPKYVDSTYGDDLRKLLKRVRRAVPDTSCLVMSPMDRGVRESGGQIGTVPALPRLVALQAKIAAEEGCAFYNTFEAMGGPGTMGKWYMAEPRLVSADFIHPMPAGGKIVASLFYDSLMKAFNSYKLQRMRNSLAEVRK